MEQISKSETVARGLLERSNQRRLSSERAIASLMVAAAMTLTGSLGYYKYGVFRIFANEADLSQWKLDAHDDWWLGLHAAVVRVDSPALLGNYLIVSNTRVAWSVVSFFFQNRRVHAHDRSRKCRRPLWVGFHARRLHQVRLDNDVARPRSSVASRSSAVAAIPWLGLFILGSH